MHGNDRARCSEDIIRIIKFHPNRRIDPITINSYTNETRACALCVGVLWICLCVSNCACVQKRTALAKVDSSCDLGVWQSSQNSLQAMATQRHKAALRMSVSVLHTCCKGDSFRPDKNSWPQPFMMPSVSWLSKEPSIICFGGGGLKWPTITRGWGIPQGGYPLCCIAALCG